MEGYEWNPAKAAVNLKRHKVDFAYAALSLEDPHALAATDPGAAGEEGFICLGADPVGWVLVTVFALAGENTRIISSRRASPGERRRYEER